ncbi:MAG: sugar phosphate isomerase/epimerase family protein [Bacteroidota bacterium]
MKLGFVTAILPDLPLSEILALAAEIGYDCVEVMCWPQGKAERRYAGVTHLDVTHFTSADAQRTLDLCQAAGVSISGLGYYPNPLSPHAEEAEVAQTHIRKVIEAAALLGIPQVNTFIGRDWQKSVEENWPTFRKVWGGLIAFAEEKEVRIGIENCPMLFTADEWPGGKNLATTPAIWQRMFTEINSPNFGLNYDPSHMVWQHMDYLRPMRDFAHKLFHIHAKDVRMDQHKLDEVGILAHPNAYHTPKLPGLGEVDWGKFISVLGDTGYDGPVCVEVEDRSFEGSLADRKAALIQSHAYLRQFMPKRSV